MQREAKGMFVRIVAEAAAKDERAGKLRVRLP